MKSEPGTKDPLHAMLARVIVETLGLDARSACELTPHAPLVGGHLGLSALDVLEVAACLEEQFDISFADAVGSRDALASIANLASFIRRQAPVNVRASLPVMDVEFDEDEVTLHDWFRV